MRLILIGPPGCGKGTQAKLLNQRLGVTHISTGDILREAVRLGTPAGRKAEPYMKGGQLVPDPLMNELVADRFHRTDRPERFVMDGYPRTVAQAQAFDSVLEELGLNLTAVIYLEVQDEELVRRACGRWICPKCQAPYHVESQPPHKPGFCDYHPDTPLVQRSDDREETVRERQRVYRMNTAELIPYYRKRGLLHEVAGQGDVETIYNAIEKALQTPSAGRS